MEGIEEQQSNGEKGERSVGKGKFNVPWKELGEALGGVESWFPSDDSFHTFFFCPMVGWLAVAPFPIADSSPPRRVSPLEVLHTKGWPECHGVVFKVIARILICCLALSRNIMQYQADLCLD